MNVEMKTFLVKHFGIFVLNMQRYASGSYYDKLVEKFHVVSECKTAVQMFDRLSNNAAILTVILLIASLLLTADRLRLAIVNRDRKDRKLDIHLYNNIVQRYV